MAHGAWRMARAAKAAPCTAPGARSLTPERRRMGLACSTQATTPRGQCYGPRPTRAGEGIAWRLAPTVEAKDELAIQPLLGRVQERAQAAKAV
jgi:hypothetical protein